MKVFVRVCSSQSKGPGSLCPGIERVVKIKILKTFQLFGLCHLILENLTLHVSQNDMEMIQMNFTLHLGQLHLTDYDLLTFN